MTMTDLCALGDGLVTAIRKKFGDAVVSLSGMLEQFLVMKNRPEELGGVTAGLPLILPRHSLPGTGLLGLME